MILTSQNPAEVFKALMTVQRTIQPIVKDRYNEHTRSRYVTLDALRDILRPLMSNAGLFMMQTVGNVEYRQDSRVPAALTVHTRFVHAESAEWVENCATVAVAEQGKEERRTTPQTTGSAITYACRYALGAALSISTEEDDDGNGGGTRPKTKQRREAQRRHAQSATSEEVNAKKITKLAEIPFPQVKGLDEYKGKPFRDVPDDKLAEALRFLSTQTGKSVTKWTKAIEDHLEQRRDQNDFNAALPAEKDTRTPRPFDK